MRVAYARNMQGIRVLSVTFVVACLFACSSSETTTPTPVDESRKCTEAGGVCAKNTPFLCPPGYEAAGGALTSVCGRQDPPPGTDGPSFVYPCCLPAVTDSGADTSDATDATDAADGFDASDSGATSDADASETAG